MEGFIEKNWFKIKLFTAISVIISVIVFTWNVSVGYTDIKNDIETVNVGYVHVKAENERIWAAVNINVEDIQDMEILQAGISKDLEYIKALLLDIQETIR